MPGSAGARGGSELVRRYLAEDLAKDLDCVLDGIMRAASCRSDPAC